MSTPIPNASGARPRPKPNVIFSDDDDAAVLRPMPLATEDALGRYSHGSELARRDDASGAKGYAGVASEQSLADGSGEDLGDDDDDVEQYLEDILPVSYTHLTLPTKRIV